MPSRRNQHLLSPIKLLLPLLLLHPSAHAQNTTKRGIAYAGNPHRPDNNLLQSPSSPLSWYYNWSPYPNTNLLSPSSLEFVPLIHGLDGAQDPQTRRQINSLPESSKHLLSFNEPDGTTDSGGSSIEPEDAARAYIEHIVPYRSGRARKWLISHPSTTGSPRGLDWLRRFNESCYEIDAEHGCPTDFIAAHWYGAFDGLVSWLRALEEFYNGDREVEEGRLRIWVTELALPQADVEATVEMMNASLRYLDESESVERYAWFGGFRTDDANEWTGDAVALFDGDGGLTRLGALYLGGEGNGFTEGQKGEGGARALALNMCLMVLCLGISVIMSGS
ncbi:uncharacterized protein EI97DRAFT_434911 [Westerdykella ornata]|uniref:Asl1-like glycosyl hydrolase catalytic domain-containing protein n=1 Tax=Westerdykella ornata TaxID=318751 RepID=A0A6A6JES3_WESOR|nr:uncharacterized protein EI97DRAFT_434911 [Westerdykella ornata]KAF2274673.1 hypothetical protein EI97DRAFT_434911 [Westerdykella ornata]